MTVTSTRPLAELLVPGQVVPAGGRHRVALAAGGTALVEVGRQGPCGRLADEVARLRWLDGRGGAPRLLGGAADGSFLVVEDRGGTPVDAHQVVLSGEVVAAAVGQALRSLHELPVDDCPFRRSVGDLLASARQRVAAGAVDDGALWPAHRRYGPAGLLDLVERSVPSSPADEVVCHGQLHLGDVLLLDGGGVGLERFGRLGVSDRCLDLAAAIGELLATYGPDVLGHFVDAYGLERPPAVWLDFFTLLGELL